MKKNVLVFLLLLFVVLFYTNGIFSNYFQQDEWGGFGSTMYLSTEPFWKLFTQFGGGHFSPLAALPWFILYKLFGFQAQYYVLVQLALHIFTSFLIYIFAGKLSKSWKIGALTAVLFATNVHASQAFLHLATFPTIVATLFVVLFFTYLVYGRGNKYFSSKDLFLLPIIFFTSAFFKEDGLIIPPLFLVYLFLFDRQKFNKKNVLVFLSFFGPIILFGIFRIVLQLTNPFSVVTLTLRFLHAYIYNVFTFPVKFIVQNLIEGGNLFTFLWTHNNLIYADNSVNVLGSYPVFIDFAFFIVIHLLAILFIFVKDNFTNKREAMNYLWLTLTWVVFDAVILSAIGRQLYILESRYLYLPSVMVFFLVSFVFIRILSANYKHHLMSLIKNIAVIGVIIGMLVNSFVGIQATVKRQAFYGTARKGILNSLLEIYPTIPQNAIFYVTCKTTCYRNGEFNIDNKYVLPFTLGSGWVILTQYAKGNEDNYAGFFNEKVENNRPFLGDLGSQGYKKVGDYGFGYYYEEASLRQMLKRENLRADVVIALEYDEDTFTLRDISSSFRQELSEI